jgi:aminoglycoside/choline kinase family phosphotransferase
MMFDDIVRKDQLFLLQFLQKKGFDAGLEDFEVLHGDGSDRRFYRVLRPQKMVAVFPSLVHPKRKEEAQSTYMIGCHLYDLGIAVPGIIGHQRDAGLVLLEDLGDEHLQTRILGTENRQVKIRLYQKAVDALLAFQIDGVKDFDIRCCWDSPKYDYELMVTRESDYFLQALCKEYAGQIFNEAGVKKECMAIALRAGREPADFLLHRDYQSRNLLVYKDEIRIIDFQGARLGPLAYDLASLLFDPYVQFSPQERETIFEYYVTQASLRLDLDRKLFTEGYQYLAVQRVLQMLGAFAFLTVHQGKRFFESFIEPALVNLYSLVQQLPCETPLLLRLIADVQKDIKDCNRFSSM